MKMYKLTIVTLIIAGAYLTFSISNRIQAQSAAKIENIKFDAEGSKLAITYDIVKYKDGETFEIWVKIVTASGKTLVPVTMYGDVNKGVSGGTGKRIVWDVEADNVTIDEEFSVEVYGRSDTKSTTQEVKEPEKEKPEKVKGTGISVGSAMALSAVLPGLGNRMVKGSGAQWLLGVAGYGCIAGSLILNNSAYNAYEDYKLADNAEERDDYFSKAESNDRISKILIGGAVAIWVADLVWTGLQAGKARKNSKSSASLNFYYDPYIKEPMVGFSYRF
jgi:hypothetical protein